MHIGRGAVSDLLLRLAVGHLDNELAVQRAEGKAAYLNIEVAVLRSRGKRLTANGEGQRLIRGRFEIELQGEGVRVEARAYGADEPAALRVLDPVFLKALAVTEETSLFLHSEFAGSAFR